MKVRQYISGKFHYIKYAKYLDESMDFRLIFSGKPVERRRPDRDNMWSFYTIMQLLIKALPDRQFSLALRVAYWFWQRSVSSQVEKEGEVDLYHCLCHGFTAKTIRKYRPGALILGEVVNAHPAIQTSLVSMSAVDSCQPVQADRGRKLIDKEIVHEAEMCDYLLSPSHFVTKSYISQGFCESKIFTINYGLEKPIAVKEVLSKKIYLKNEKIRVVCVGQVIPRKGQLLLVKAVANILNKGFDLDITLYGRAEALYLKQIRALGVSVDHIPHMENSKLQKKLREFDVFVMPSYEDGFAVAVTEALSVGLPVIVSSAVGAADLLKYKTSSVFKVGCKNDLELKITNFISGKYREEIVDVASWKTYATTLKLLYEKCLK